MTQAEIKIREAAPDESAIILHHRRSMFRDMGEGTVEELDRMVEVAGPWLARALADGSYRHWLALDGSGRVAGGGQYLLGQALGAHADIFTVVMRMGARSRHAKRHHQRRDRRRRDRCARRAPRSSVSKSVTGSCMIVLARAS